MNGYPMQQPAMPSYQQQAPQPLQDSMQPQGMLNPQLVQSILGLQQQQAAQQRIARQRQLADMMRADATRGLEGRQAGRVYVPPGLANLGAAVMAGYKGRKLNEDADVREMNLGAQKQDALQRYFQAMSGGRQRPALGHMGDEGE
jgi:hypothetical protein